MYTITRNTSDPSSRSPLLCFYFNSSCFISHFCLSFFFLFAVTNYKQQSSSLEADSCPTGQEVPYLLWNPQVYCCFHKSSLLVLILSHVCLVNTITHVSLRSTLILSSHLHIGLPCCLLP